MIRRAPAFTLVEVVVASTAMVIIAAAAVGILGQTYGTQSEGSIRNQLARDAQLVSDILTRDLQYAGVGVPRGFRNDVADFTGGTRASHQLRPIFRRLKPDHLVLVGDLPYPNADLNGLADVVHTKVSDDHRTFITSELSGCVPPSSAGSSNYRCDTSTASFVGPFPAADRCVSGQPNRRTCPWGMNKWQEGSLNTHLIFSAGDHSWYEREWDQNPADVDDDGPYFGIHLEHDSPNGNTWGSGSDQELPAGRFFAARGGGFVAQLDRVFWSLEDAAPGSVCSSTTSPFCVLRRRQCFGPIIDPAAPNFPVVGDSAFRANLTPTTCNPAQNDGTDWEVVIDGVRAINFVAFDGAGAPITGTWDPAAAARVKTIGFTLELERRIPGTNRTLKHITEKRVLIRNRGGIIGALPADGGCNISDPTDPGACGGDEG